MNTHKILVSLLIIIFSVQSIACTTAIISGKVTPDGRPLLWKHRDTWALNNKIVQFFDGKYNCVGLVNSVDTTNLSIWIGFNSEGFAIMNSASYNLNYDTIDLSGLEGRLIKEALQNCATVNDFEQMIIDMDKPTRLEGNFGVIDAHGEAAYFELGNFNYVKFDANNPDDAPNGYIIRTNYSFSGNYGDGGGYIRYVTIDDVFQRAIENDNLDYLTILQEGSRNLKHSLLEIDLNLYNDIPENTPSNVFFKDYIPRYGTSSSCIVQGVKPDEDPELVIMWSMIGFPLTTLTIPIWLNVNVELPEIAVYNKSISDSPLSNYSLQLKDQVFAYKLGVDTKYYIDINKVINADNTGFVQKIVPLENKIIDKSEKYLLNWRNNNKLNNNDLKELYEWIDKVVTSFYETNFDLSFNE